MVGQIQQSAAVSLRSRMAQAREQVALAQQRQRLPRQDQHPREPRPDLAPRPHSTADRSRSTAQLPPALPLTSEEADLFERLSPLLAKPPRRSAAPQHRVDTVTTERFADTLEAAPDPEMIEDAPLDPPRRLPLADFQADRAAEAPRTITWQQRSKRARWRSGVRRAGAWMMTSSVIAATVSGAVLAGAGLEKSTQILVSVEAQAHKSVTALYAELAPLIKR